MGTKTFWQSRTAEATSKLEKPELKFSTKITVPIRKTKEVNGRIYSYLENTEIDNAEENAKQKPEDFMLDNLIETGATADLQERRIIPQTLMTIDRTNEALKEDLKRMDAEEWANKYLNKEKENIKENKEE